MDKLSQIIGANNYNKLKSSKLLVLITKYSQLMKFAIAGSIGAVAEIFVFVFLVEFTGIFYLISNIISITVGILLNYLVSHKWVFEEGRYPKKLEFTFFLLVSIIVIICNQFMVWFMVEIVAFDTSISKILAIISVSFISFFAQKYLVFKN